MNGSNLTRFSRTLDSGTSGRVVLQTRQRGVRRLAAGLLVILAIGVGGLVSLAIAFDLIDLDGSNGFVINGIQDHVFDAFGASVSNVGDINNDGISDVIIGDPSADPSGYSNIGECYVVFGSASGFAASIEISNVDGSNGFFINGLTTYESLGASVSNAGDVNADGIDDVIIGAPMAFPNGKYIAGRAYVVFGSATGFDAHLDVTKLDGSNGFVINGAEANDQTGRSVSGGGDVNGDGIDDIIIGAPTGFLSGVSREGKGYVVFGSSLGFSPTLELSDLNGSNGFLINGIDLNDHTGYAVSAAGDVNADGVDDVVIGAPNAAPDGRGYAGKAYVVFGSRAGFSATLQLSDLDGSNGFAINGIDAGDYLARGAVSGAGDVNGDGIDDFMLGAANAAPDGRKGAGETYVVFGSDLGFSAILELSDLNGSNGFVINGIAVRDHSGNSVSGAGDVNGDGIADVVIGAPCSLIVANQIYVVFGSRSGFSATLELSDLGGGNGFVLNGFDASGIVSAAGDINSDGTDDIIIGATGHVGGYSGKAYVVFGQPSSVDSDGDGIPDSLDACPTEDATGFDADGDGCIDSADDLGTLVESLLEEGVIDEAMENCLLSKIENAENSADKDNICTAINQLEALKNSIDAQSGKKISDEAADQIIAYVDSLIAWYLDQLPEEESC